MKRVLFQFGRLSLMAILLVMTIAACDGWSPPPLPPPPPPPPPAPPPPPPPGGGCGSGKLITTGVNYYDCSGNAIPVYVVTIDKKGTFGDFSILTNPSQPTAGANLTLTPIETLAKNGGAVVAVNGFTWNGGSGYANIPGSSVGTPTTDVFINSTQLYQFAAPVTLAGERLMGFTQNNDNRLDAKMIDGSNLGDVSNDLYKYMMYGSTTAVMRSGACFSPASNFDKGYYSVVGYSDTQILFFTFGASLGVNDICSVLSKFSTIDAVRQDGSGAATMYVQGVGRIDPDYGMMAGARSVAYGIGFVVPQ